MVARLQRHAAAYPALQEVIPAVEQAWLKGKVTAHIVPFAALNPPGAAPQVAPCAISLSSLSRSLPLFHCCFPSGTD